MGYRNLRECLDDLARTGQLVRIDEPIDPHLEMAEIQRRVFAAGGPALYFASVRGCSFPMVSNLFGTMERVRFIFRDTLDRLRQMVELGADPADVFKRPRLLLKLPWWARHARPKTVRRGPVLANTTTLDRLPGLVSWPNDGGAYITLPLVYTEDPTRPGYLHSNLGMYRVQISGGKYERNQVGLHYQIHRGIGIHHAKAIESKQKLRVNVFVGGPPAAIVAAVMPLPENMSELLFAGLLGGRRIAMIRRGDELPIMAEADFALCGYIEPRNLLPEGPFGDHLGYYSLQHDFPVMRVEKIYHRSGAVWPFTVVGRPPQEDTMFGRLIHELVGPIIPKTIPGVRAVHAVDEAGVHPLLLAVGSERYTPYSERERPQELLTQASAILGQGQLSLAKYLFIAATEDDPELDVYEVDDFLRHILERVDWRRDLHFHTETTADTLDYTCGALNRGSKVVIAAVGKPRRTLPVGIDTRLQLPKGLGFEKPHVILPGILVVQGPPFSPDERGKDIAVAQFCAHYTRKDAINLYPLVVVVDDAHFAASSLSNFLWTTFTRSDPASDIYGIDATTTDKHWGCAGSLVIDARAKPHHPPPLIEDPEITERVDKLAAPGGPLHGII
ncbi:MAG: UbiD family decarboxylase [Planctomycetota bacterium]|nr:MAG: UbiD family decarboxylase [Planctomycetota bacterium]